MADQGTPAQVTNRAWPSLCGLAAAFSVLAAPIAALGQDGEASPEEADLAKKLANPVSSLITVPFQLNYDCCTGQNSVARTTLNIQPVVPIDLGPDTHLILRTIMPVIDQQSASPGAKHRTGLGDITQSFFFGPSKPTAGGLTWAVGPVFLYPTGGNGLSTDKWGAGPTFVVLKQSGHTTVGMLANHIWSFAGDDARPQVNQSFLQPFFSYTTPKATTYSANIEASYDWSGRVWSAPLNLTVSHVYKFGGQRVQLAAGGKIFLDGNRDGPDWGLRTTATLLFPR